MRLHVGTSGYSYAEWKGTFYPEGMPAAKMLAYYAERFGTVEINATFYRMPRVSMFEKWMTQVPESFLFALKAPQRITHMKKLVDVGDDVRYFCDVAATLGPRLGPLLFQLPPFAHKDVEKLRSLLATLPAGPRVAMEFRHDSWCDNEVYDVLRERDVAVCLSDTDDVADPAALMVPTASWGYLRLRRTEYAEGMLGAWRERIEAQPWDQAFVFFKHEDEGKGPQFAREFLGA
ncbi:MAG TPA: DUF72 domain-containing protein [Thermoanaerobaculia bacterium]|nr:DUF72 domain-containing protein [Thermoanaerobaculia bacterium]